jgi:hypothetical protein
VILGISVATRQFAISLNITDNSVVRFRFRFFLFPFPFPLYIKKNKHLRQKEKNFFKKNKKAPVLFVWAFCGMGNINIWVKGEKALKRI